MEKNFDSEDHASAIKFYSEEIEKNPEVATNYNNRGYAYSKLGENVKAILDFTKAIELDYKNETCYNNRGLCYYESGEYEKAIRDFTKIIELNTDDYGDLICLVRSGVELAYKNLANCYR